MFQKALESLNRIKIENPQFKKFIEVSGVLVEGARFTSELVG